MIIALNTTTTIVIMILDGMIIGDSKISIPIMRKIHPLITLSARSPNVMGGGGDILFARLGKIKYNLDDFSNYICSSTSSISPPRLI